MENSTRGWFENLTNETSTQIAPNEDDIVQFKTAKITYYSIVMLLTLVGNSFVVATFYRNRTLRTTPNYLILNMAVSDSLQAVFVSPWRIGVTYNDRIWLITGILGDILCKLVHAAQGVSAMVSALSMVVIAADRFYAILYPMKPAPITNKLCRGIIAVIWVMSVALQYHYIHGYRINLQHNGFTCWFRWGTKSDTEKARKIGFSVLLSIMLITTLMMAVFYSTIIAFLHQQQKELRLRPCRITQRVKQNRKIALMLVSVVVVFVAVWLLLYVKYSLRYFSDPPVEMPLDLRWIANNVPMLYPVINPVIYYVFNRKYRQGFNSLVSFIFCRRAWRPKLSVSSQQASKSTVIMNQNFQLEERNCKTKESKNDCADNP